MKKNRTVNPSEHAIQNLILEYLATKRLFFWRNNVGSAVFENKKTGKQRFIRFGIAGAPDVFVLKQGQLYGLEVKSAKGKLQPSQIEFQKGFEAAGGFYAVVRSLDEVIGIGL